MTRRKSVQELVKPFRKLSLLGGGHLETSNNNSKSTNSEQEKDKQVHKEHVQRDIVSCLPREIALYILAMLPFADLVRVQLTCRWWRRLAQDAHIWRTRYLDLCRRFPDLDLPDNMEDQVPCSWQARYCRAQTQANWRMGCVQRTQLISQHGHSRILSVKLRKHFLVTLTEDNSVSLYMYSRENGFRLQTAWHFGDTSQTSNIVECVDVLPEMNVLVVAMRGSKCMFYDVSSQDKEPIQVLKGGSHPWFVPDSVALNQDYFAVSGRKPSAVFIWNWRKGVRLSNRGFDNQPHSVYLCGNSVITISVDGLVQTFDIFDHSKGTATFSLPPCNMPSLEYDGSLSIVLAPFAARRIHHFQWSACARTTSDPLAKSSSSESSCPPMTATTRSSRRRLSSILGKSCAAKKKRTSCPAPDKPASSTTQRRLRRYSSYNDYGYACQARTAQYVKDHQQQQQTSTLPVKQPDFSSRLQLVNSIRTTPLGWTTKEVVSVAVHNGRVAVVNRYGDIALFALNGTTAALVALSKTGERPWMEYEETCFRDEDDLSDGYDFVRSRLAMGSMGIIYGGRSGSLWWLDFGCKPDL